jgi:hypothetical protein
MLVATGVGRADLVHRWSFNGDTKDSVGGKDAILNGGAKVDTNNLILDGVDSYALLPIGNTLINLNSYTIEGWATWGAFQNPWSRIFDFGNDTLENMFLTPRNGNNHTVRYAITIGGAAGEQDTETLSPFPVGTETHFAISVDASAGISALYINGQIQAMEFGVQVTPSMFSMAPPNNYLGKSQYNDPYFLGMIDEFRVYNNALSPDDVAASFQAGPDAP